MPRYPNRVESELIQAIAILKTEAPSINSQNNDTLQKGMAITIEPGIYLEGEFGYRHEDTILLQ